MCSMRTVFQIHQVGCTDYIYIIYINIVIVACELVILDNT